MNIEKFFQTQYKLDLNIKNPICPKNIKRYVHKEWIILINSFIIILITIINLNRDIYVKNYLLIILKF